MIKYIVKIFVVNQLVRINLMEKQRIRCSEQNNYSNCSLPPGGVLPHTLCLRKELCNSDFFIIIKEHILLIYRPYCSHIIYIKYFFSYCWKWDHLLWSVFTPVHHQCKLHGENFCIALVNVVHSYNTLTLSCAYFGQNIRGVFYTTLPTYAKWQ